MKMNKLAAGALALALGLGAVAPAVAAEEKTVKSELTSYEIFLKQHDKLVKEINEILAENAVAQEKIDKAEARLDAAKARLKEANEAYIALFPSHVQVIKGYTTDENNEKQPVFFEVGELELKEVTEAQNALNELLIEGKEVGYENDLKKDAVNKKWIKDNAKDKVDPDVLDAAIERYTNAVNDYKKTLEGKEDNPRLLAYQEVLAARAERDVAQTNYDKVVEANSIKDYTEKLDALKKAAEGYGFSVQVGNAGLKITDEKIEQEEEFDLKELAAAREKAVTTLEAVRLLEELTPEKIADVKEELDELVAEQKDLIKLADKYLDKEIALFSTAYAAEDDEEMSAEELTDKLNEKSDKIQDLIKDKEEPAEDDKEDDEKPAEDDKEDEEEPAEDDKEDEEKPAENKPSKGAGNNAKTGIAGVAGVAGILAAASVAYAASKRD